MTGDVSKYYFETILPALALLAAMHAVFDQWLASAGGKKTSRRAVGALASPARVWLWAGDRGAGGCVPALPKRPTGRHPLCARENTRPEDTVLVWRDTRVNYFAQRDPLRAAW